MVTGKSLLIYYDLFLFFFDLLLLAWLFFAIAIFLALSISTKLACELVSSYLLTKESAVIGSS